MTSLSGNSQSRADDDVQESTVRNAFGPGTPKFTRVWVLVATVAAIGLSINQIFNFGFFVGHVLISLQYFYLLMFLLLPLVFVIKPSHATKNSSRPPLVDIVLAVITKAVLLYMAIHADQIVEEAWEYSAPDPAMYCAVIIWIVAIEVTRRAGGLTLAIIATIFSVYPLIAGYVPGPIQSQQIPIDTAAKFYAMSAESYMGIPMRAFAGLIIGFLVFGVALQSTGGGRFFMNLAFGLLGHTRGGPAKVAIFASALMGSLSGSVVTNILTTGTLTIPAMRRIGISQNYAAGIETCASTGAVLMPPVMGATAFVMATFLEIEYAEIAIAAIVPSALYFLALFIQIDGYAARNDLTGLDRSQLPKISRTLIEGWYYVFVFALLIFMLLYLKREALAPFYATGLLLLINQILPHNRWSKADLVEAILSVGKILIELIGILMGIGLIIGALSVTGLTGTLTSDLVQLAGNQALLLLLMGAVISFILGMGMTVTAAYIFLAITLAPALVKAGIDPLPAHMFILYWGMLSYITPPVAIGAYAAATISGGNAFKTGLVAMKLGSVIYIIPFLFVLDSSLLLQGDVAQVALSTITAIFGVVLIGSSLQGYLFFAGSLEKYRRMQWPVRFVILISGLLLALPDMDAKILPFDAPSQTIFALVSMLFMIGVFLTIALLNARSRKTV